jgi:hypothetical protein
LAALAHRPDRGAQGQLAYEVEISGKRQVPLFYEGDDGLGIDK